MLNYQKTKEAPNLKSIIVRDPYFLLKKKWGKKYENYREIWKNAGKRLCLTDFPTHLDVDITNSCNLACRYCPQSTFKFFSETNMTTDVFLKILKEAKKEGLFSINIGWNAEPLLNPKLFLELLEILDRFNFLDIFLHTNVLNFNEEIQKRVLESKITTVCFSLGEVQDRKDKLEIVKKNIINFKRLRDKIKKELPLIRIGIIPTAANRGKIAGYLDFWKKYGDYIELQDSTLIGEKIGNIYEKKKFICNNPWRRLGITSNGDIYPCCGFTYFSKDLKLGNIGSLSLKEAWHSAKIKELRERLEKDNEAVSYAGCRQCLNSLYTLNLKTD